MLGQGGGDLSGGQKKRVALARALLRKPEVIVIDQMASDLEASLNREIFTRLSREFEGAILYLGHRVPDGFVPDAVYWLEDGRLAPREHLA
jgi:ATP-binding cassette subfamily B protein